MHELEALARISEAVSESLYLEESLEAIVRTTVRLARRHGRGARARGRTDRLARGARRHARRAHAAALAGRRIGELVVDRDTPFTDEDRQLLEAIAHQAAVALEHGRMALRGVLAQEIHHRVKNNLQTVASLLRLQARAEGVDPQKALGDSVNRILAIAAVHEVLTEHREDVVELDELDRPAARDARPGARRGQGSQRRARARSARRASGRRRSRSSSASCFGNALEHGGRHDLHYAAGATAATSCSPSPTTATGMQAARRRHGPRRSSARSCATSSAGR